MAKSLSHLLRGFLINSRDSSRVKPHEKTTNAGEPHIWKENYDEGKQKQWFVFLFEIFLMGSTLFTQLLYDAERDKHTKFLTRSKLLSHSKRFNYCNGVTEVIIQTGTACSKHSTLSIACNSCINNIHFLCKWWRLCKTTLF